MLSILEAEQILPSPGNIVEHTLPRSALKHAVQFVD
jgi:hypothetical protein